MPRASRRRPKPAAAHERPPSSAGSALDILTLPGTALSVSRLGYGCSQLMARMDRRQSIRLLQAAFDAGVTHFDVARSYGYGEAEVALGDFATEAGRGNVTLATKFGILPPRRSALLSAAKAAARVAAAAVPPLRRLLRSGASSLVRAGMFDTATAGASLEASLRALRTDHVDMLLLHECEAADLTDELLAFLERVRREGKVLHYGLAAYFGPTAEALRHHPDFTSIVQLPDSVFQPNLRHLPPPAREPVAVVTHSALGPRFAALCDRLAADAPLARRWSGILDFDAARDRGALAGLCLAAATAANGAGATLFSSTREANIAANIAAAGTFQALTASASRIEALRALVDAAGPGGAPNPSGGRSEPCAEACG